MSEILQYDNYYYKTSILVSNHDPKLQKQGMRFCLEGEDEECCPSRNSESSLASKSIRRAADEDRQRSRSSDDGRGGRWRGRNDRDGSGNGRSNRRNIDRSTSTSFPVRSDRTDTSRGGSSPSECGPS